MFIFCSKVPDGLYLLGLARPLLSDGHANDSPRKVLERRALFSNPQAFAWTFACSFSFSVPNNVGAPPGSCVVKFEQQVGAGLLTGGRGGSAASQPGHEEGPNLSTLKFLIHQVPCPMRRKKERQTICHSQGPQATSRSTWRKALENILTNQRADML